MYVNVAQPGATLDIGISSNGHEIADDVPLGNIGAPDFYYTQAEVAQDGYIYVTPSEDLSDGDITIRYVVWANYGSSYALYLAAFGHVTITDSYFISNGASDAAYINPVSAPNTVISNSTFITSDPVNQYAIQTDSEVQLNLKNSSFIGKLQNATPK